jgi:hypothetical protein
VSQRQLRIALREGIDNFITTWLQEHSEAKLNEIDVIMMFDCLKLEYAKRYDKKRKEKGMNKYGEYY